MSPTNDVEPTLMNSSASFSLSPTSRNNLFSSKESSDETSPRKFRSLKEIYETCQFALSISDPTTFEGATTKEEW